MDVDPVVGEEVLAVEHERDGQEVAVAQALGGLGDRGGGAGSVMPAVARSGSDEMTASGSMISSGVWTATHSSSTNSRRVAGVFEADLAAELLDAGGHRLPHLARAVAGVLELVDQRLDLVALVAEEGGLGGAEEAQALDALGGPLGAHLGGGDAPDLLRVALEEVGVEALAEAVGDPGLEVVLAALGLHRGPHVAQRAAHELDRAELLDDVGALERVVEVAPAPVDARHARAHEELVAHDLEPEVVDLFALGEEAVPAEVEAVALGVDDGLGQAADLLVGLQHDDAPAGLGQLVARGQPGRAAADDDIGAVAATVASARGFDLEESHAGHRPRSRGRSSRGPNRC